MLVPGGYFLYTDVLQREEFNQCVEVLRSLAFEVESDRDITSNVLRSCDEITFSNSRAFRSGTDARLIQNFLGTLVLQHTKEMKNGTLMYRMLKLRKRPQL